MSSSNQVAGPSTDNFTAIFNAASNDYLRLDTCYSPEAVSNVLRTQAQAFKKFLKGDENLMTWLSPTVNILFAFSATLGGGIGVPFPPAKTIFTGIRVLLGSVRDVVASHDKLIHLFERINFFLQRLNVYTEIPLTNDLTELLGKIMVQLLSILAISTKEMTDRKMKKFLKRLVGKTDVEDALERLDTLTKEESLMAVTRNLKVTHRVDGNVMAVKGGVHGIKDVIRGIDSNIKDTKGLTEIIDDNVKATKHVTEQLERNQLQEKLRTWLAAPDPSINHNIACKTQHVGTAGWFIQGSTFRDWKNNGSYSGAGKSILCSAIIEDIKIMRDARSALIAWYYFDFKDAFKRNEMLKLPGQLPIFIIVDALDECPNTTGTPSAREEVLDLVEDLVGSNHSNLFICVTSRPEHDVQTILNPLTPASRRVSLHEEGGQREDIDSYIRSFVLKDRAMQRWREEDRELVITTLSRRAEGMFRWAFCQLDTLRRCLASSIRKALNELPTTLDDTYERALQEISKEKWQHAHRLFQCLVAAIRPLRVEELAEIFAIRFDADGSPGLMEGWRPENSEEALLSACSTLIAIVENEGSKITSEVGNICNYHIPLDAAHTILARSCLTVLLQLDENVDEERLEKFPLALYAAEHWVDHAKFEDVALRIQDDMKRLFNPRNPYLTAWVWICDVDWGHIRDPFEKHPSPPNATPLYFASVCGFSGLANYIIYAHGEDVNAKSGYHETPLRAASYNRHMDVVRVLLDHGANVNTIDKKNTPLSSAYDGKHLEIMRLLLEHGADADALHRCNDLVLHQASIDGQAEVVHLLLRHNADVNARGEYDWTPLQCASFFGHTKVVQLLLDLNGFREIVQLLLEHGADVNIRDPDGEDHTPYQAARLLRRTEIVELLLEYGAKK
ncbi:hypothetical protein BJV77DRAFT_1071565 [Russula vinacea]|nr:hypothetical protein BJV77DRAFT_1071565 [Russula vinacea]